MILIVLCVYVLSLSAVLFAFLVIDLLTILNRVLVMLNFLA